MKLYYSKGACSLAVRISIHEMNLPCEFEAVDLATKKTEQGADYLKINPKGAVPALVMENGSVLTENAVIQQFLAEKHKAFRLLPAVGEEKRYSVLEWLNFASTDLHKSFGPLFNGSVPDDVKKSVFIPLVKKRLDYLNHTLASTTYVAGEEFTLPDAYIFTVLRWLRKFDISLAQHPHVERYVNQLKQRQSVQISLQEEGLH